MHSTSPELYTPSLGFLVCFCFVVVIILWYGLTWPMLAWNSLCIGTDFDLLILQSLCFPSARIYGHVPQCPVWEVVGMAPKNSCMLGKHSTTELHVPSVASVGYILIVFEGEECKRCDFTLELSPSVISVVLF